MNLQFGDGDFFGWLTRLAVDRPAAATIIAVTPVTCLVFGREEARCLVEIGAVARGLIGDVMATVCQNENELGQ